MEGCFDEWSDACLADVKDVCCVQGRGGRFPSVLCSDFLVDGVGIIVCVEGSFTFRCEGIDYMARGGETVFLSQGVVFKVVSQSDDCCYSLILYKVDTIRNILGNTIAAMKLLETLNPTTCRVWHTGQESDLCRYSEMLASGNSDDNMFAENERTLLLLSLTYRLCSIFTETAKGGLPIPNRKLDIYVGLVKLVEENYMRERGVKFYADKLFLSPKYLTSIVKSMSGCTVQQLVFKAITKKAIFFISNTDKSIKEISDTLGFPNASAFGTFFRKQVGMSPANFRKNRQGDL